MRKGLVYFEVEGEPRAWKRIKRSFTGGKFVAYEDKQSTAHKEAVALIAKSRGLEVMPKTSSLALVLKFVCETKRRIDIDNLIKQIFDALSFSFDDSQVMEVYAVKQIGAGKGNGKTTVQIWELNV